MAETGTASNERPATAWCKFKRGEEKSLSPSVVLSSSFLPKVRECQSSVCAVVLQLRDDGDQVLETKEVTTVQALVHHAVSLEMSAGGVGKIYHPHIHRGAAVV